MSKFTDLSLLIVMSTLGASAWAISLAALPEWLISTELASDLAHSLPFEFFGLPFSMTVTFVSGFINPKRFWLWGIAIALLIPFVGVTLASVQILQGSKSFSNVDTLVTLAFLSTFSTIMMCTMTSAIGAGIRVLLRRRALESRAGGVQNGGSVR